MAATPAMSPNSLDNLIGNLVKGQRDLGRQMNAWSPWTALTLGTNVVYSDVTFYRPAYRYNLATLEGQLRGVLRPTASLLSGATVASIPEAQAWPTMTVMVFQGTANTPTLDRISIGTTGAITTQLALTTANYIALDGVSYSLAANF